MLIKGYEKTIDDFIGYIKILEKRKILKDGMKVADIGCASGLFLSLLNSSVRKYGFDCNDEYKSSIDTKEKDIIFKKINLESETIQGSFDLITLFDSIEHFRNYKNLSEIISNCLTDNGVIVITTPNANSLTRFIARSSFTVELDQTHVTAFTTYTLRFMMQRMGLTEIFSYTPFSFLKIDGVFNTVLPMGGQIICAYRKQTKNQTSSLNERV